MLDKPLEYGLGDPHEMTTEQTLMLSSSSKSFEVEVCDLLAALGASGGYSQVDSRKFSHGVPFGPATRKSTLSERIPFPNLDAFVRDRSYDDGEI